MQMIQFAAMKFCVGNTYSKKLNINSIYVYLENKCDSLMCTLNVSTYNPIENT